MTNDIDIIYSDNISISHFKKFKESNKSWKSLIVLIDDNYTSDKMSNLCEWFKRHVEVIDMISFVGHKSVLSMPKKEYEKWGKDENYEKLKSLWTKMCFTVDIVNKDNKILRHIEGTKNECINELNKYYPQIILQTFNKEPIYLSICGGTKEEYNELIKKGILVTL